MEVHRGTALARYQASSDEVKQLASKTFQKLDKDKDGKVQVGDLVDFVKQGGYGGVKPSLFEEIGKDKHDQVDFEEAVSVFYAAKNKVKMPPNLNNGLEKRGIRDINVDICNLM